MKNFYISVKLTIIKGVPSPMRELIGSVMVSSLLLPTFGTLSLPLYFRLPSTFLPSKGRSIATLGTRWHDFFITLFKNFIKLFYSFYCLSFPFLEGCRLEKGAHCARSVFPFIIKKKKKKKTSRSPQLSFTILPIKFLVTVAYLFFHSVYSKTFFYSL